MPSMSSDYAKNRAMKSKKAEEILSASSVTDSCGYEYLLTSCAKRAVEIAEQEMEEKLTRWNDPKEVLPEPNKDVLVKCSSGQIQTDFYAPELGGFFIEHSTYAKVIGWREMM